MASMRPEMAARPLHLFEAGVVTEQRFMGLQEAPAVLGPLLADRLGAEKRVRIPFNPRERWLSAAREACRAFRRRPRVTARRCDSNGLGWRVHDRRGRALG